MAHRIRDLQSLPYVVVTEKNMWGVYEVRAINGSVPEHSSHVRRIGRPSKGEGDEGA